jgi:sulfur carrier protein
MPDPAHRILINGEEHPLSAATLDGLLAERGIDAGGRGVAVARNGALVPRGRWTSTMLEAGDSIEIVMARQGG